MITLNKAQANDLVKRLHSELQRTTEISYADVVAFAGAAAIEAVGGPKVTVQLGRDDAKAAEPEGAREGFSWEEPTLDAQGRRPPNANSWAFRFGRDLEHMSVLDEGEVFLAKLDLRIGLRSHLCVLFSRSRRDSP